MSAPAVAEMLGGSEVLQRAVASDLDLADAVRAGFPAEALEHLLGELRPWVGAQAAVLRIVGSERTLQRKRGGRTPLSATESDRLARLARILVRTEQALDDPERARRWLTQENRALGGTTPLALLDSDAGAEAVEQVLGRIEHGLYE